MSNLTEIIGLALGFLLTILIFSYLMGDNPFFRLAIHIFIGVSAAYVALITVNNVLIPRLILPLINGTQGERLLSIILFIPCIFLFFKVTPLRKAGNWAVAILVGIGAAAAIGGAITGTLFPQMLGTINSVDPSAYTISTSRWDQAINGLIIVIGTLTTLLYFHFGTQDIPGQSNERLPFIESISKIGKMFLAITFGALYAGVYLSSLAALVERLSFIWDFLNTIGFQLFSAF
jgi:predicted membrane protein